MKKIRFLNLSVKNPKLIKEKLKVFKKFLLKGQFIMGNEVEKLEKKIAKFIGTKYAIGVSSGTNALYLSLKALGIQKGDEVLVPSMSWHSTFTSIIMSGATPVPVDIDEDLIISTKDIKKFLNKKTKAVVLVHFTGLVSKINELKKFCKSNNLYLIEDAAQAFGAKFNGKRAGSIGDIAAFSLNPIKIFSGYGESGMICTSNKIIKKKLEILRYAGLIKKKNYECHEPELNHKIDELQASLLLHKLNKVDFLIKKRINNAEYYQKFLSKKIEKPKFKKNFEHIYYTYTVKVKRNRKKFIKYLNKSGIETQIQHSKLVTDHKNLKKYLSIKSSLKNANKIKERIISIPIHENLSKNQLNFICNKVNYYMENHA